jgi:hypothetical protein
MVAGLEREGLRRQVGTTVVAGWLAATPRWGCHRAGRAEQSDGKSRGGGKGVVSFSAGSEISVTGAAEVDPAMRMPPGTGGGWRYVGAKVR